MTNQMRTSQSGIIPGRQWELRIGASGTMGWISALFFVRRPGTLHENWILKKKTWFIKHHVHHCLHHHNNHCHHHDHSLPSKPAMVGHVRNFWSPSWNSPFAYGCICTYVCLMCMSTSLSPCLSVSAGNCMTACHVCMPVCIHSMPSIPLFPWTNNLIYCREASGNHS